MLKLQKSVPQVEPPRPDTQFHDDSIVHEKLLHLWIPAMAYYRLDVTFDFLVTFFEAHYIPKLQLPSSQHSVWRCQTPGTNSTRGSCCSPALLPLSENYTIEFRGLRACYSEICSTSWPGGLDLHFFHWNFLFFGGIFIGHFWHTLSHAVHRTLGAESSCKGGWRGPVGFCFWLFSRSYLFVNMLSLFESL